MCLFLLKKEYHIKKSRIKPAEAAAGFDYDSDENSTAAAIKVAFNYNWKMQDYLFKHQHPFW